MRQEIKIPTPQLQDVYKRWKGLEPTGFEWVDRVREYYIGLLRKELQERGALPSDNPGQRYLRVEEREARRVLGLPGEEKRISPALAIIPIGLGLGLAAVVGMVALAQAAPRRPEPSDLLISYQQALDEAHGHVEAGYPDAWIMIPDYGLQYAHDAIPQLEGLMIEEAISIGLISSASDCYFVRAIMYYSDGTIIVG